jgi:hypothetical protein
MSNNHHIKGIENKVCAICPFHVMCDIGWPKLQQKNRIDDCLHPRGNGLSKNYKKCKCPLNSMQIATLISVIQWPKNLI